MTKVKNQHYVPRFYLNHFLNDSGKIWAFDKWLSKEYITNVNSIANENYFYDHSNSHAISVEEQFIEKRLSEVEGQIAPVYESLISDLNSDRFTSLSEDIRNCLCQFLVIQILRGKETREDMFDFASTLRKATIEKGWLENEDLEKFNLNIKETDKKDIHLEMLLSSKLKENLFNALNSHIWIIFKNETIIPFYSSDNPISKKKNIFNGIRSNSGYKSEGIEISFPLSSKYILVILERKHFNDFRNLDNLLIALTDTQNITYYNSLQVISCNRQIYSQEKLFDLPIEMINQNPELSNPNRKRSEYN